MRSVIYLLAILCGVKAYPCRIGDLTKESDTATVDAPLQIQCNVRIRYNRNCTLFEPIGELSLLPKHTNCILGQVGTDLLDISCRNTTSYWDMRKAANISLPCRYYFKSFISKYKKNAIITNEPEDKYQNWWLFCLISAALAGIIWLSTFLLADQMYYYDNIHFEFSAQDAQQFWYISVMFLNTLLATIFFSIAIVEDLRSQSIHRGAGFNAMGSLQLFSASIATSQFVYTRDDRFDMNIAPNISEKIAFIVGLSSAVGIFAGYEGVLGYIVNLVTSLAALLSASVTGLLGIMGCILEFALRQYDLI